MLVDEEDESFDPVAHQRMLQDLKRQIMRKLDPVDDEVLLQAVLEMVTDAEMDIMEGDKDPELAAAAEFDDDLLHPDNRKRPAPIHQKNKNDADSWLDGLGR
jgi:hypothetical protein